MRAQGVGGSAQLANIVSLFDAPASVGVGYITKIEKLTIQGKSELVRCGKKKPENGTKSTHVLQSRPQMMSNRSLVFCSPNKCL